MKLLKLPNKKIIINLIMIFTTILFYSCETKTGDVGSTTTETTSSYDTYTDTEISRISNNMGTNILNLQNLENKGLTSSQYSYLEANIISLLGTIVNEVYTGKVLDTRDTEVTSAVAVEVARMGILSYTELTVVRGQIDAAITSYLTYGLTTTERDQLIGIRSNIDEVQTQITYNQNLNPYYVELYWLYHAYFKETTYNLNDNESLLNSIGVNLSNVDITSTLDDKISLIAKELVELNNYAIEANGYPDTLVDSLTTALEALQTAYESYTLGQEGAVSIAESQFRSSDITLLNSYSNQDGLSGNQELTYCNNMYSKVMALSSSQYVGYESEYNRVRNVLVDFETKRLAYYGGDTAGSEDYQDTTGNFLTCVSSTVNTISTYQYLKANHYPFMD